ncbi:MAG: 50S ribosomal protein L11 methyltransferase [Ruminococcaceae bacterium]|nr:50S ribosomal protein L11 methyltransferase [Oscillospiraceae bacterium]
MQWLELTIQTASGGIDLLCAELTDNGFDSFVVEDSCEFHDFLETSQEYWDYVDESLSDKMKSVSLVRLYLAEETAQQQLDELRALLRAIPERYCGIDFGALTIALENIADEDWENSWKKHYRPLPVGQKLLVIPQWMRVEDTDGRLPVILDLGLTFGTGAHDSTQMCMRALERLVQGGERVADLGSGSGILSICALRLGAESALGVDIDPAAEHIARGNALLNGFDERVFNACTGNVVQDEALMHRISEGGYDIVCANIVAGVIVQLVSVVPQLLRENGTFLCSGIVREREEEVRQAIESVGLRIIDCERTEQWCCLLAK